VGGGVPHEPHRHGHRNTRVLRSGTRPEVRLDLHAEFVAALRAADVPTTVLDARELDHAEVSVDIGAEGDTVMTPAVMSFLTECFATEP
jgi:hypothetical protein